MNKRRHQTATYARSAAVVFLLLTGCMSTSQPSSSPLENRVKLLESTVTRMELQSTAAVSNLEKRVQKLEESQKTLTALVQSRPSIPQS